MMTLIKYPAFTYLDTNTEAKPRKETKTPGKVMKKGKNIEH